MSEKAGNDYSAAVEAWGKAMELQIGRLCRFEVAIGMSGLKCPAAPDAGS